MSRDKTAVELSHQVHALRAQAVLCEERAENDTASEGDLAMRLMWVALARMLEGAAESIEQLLRELATRDE